MNKKDYKKIKLLLIINFFLRKIRFFYCSIILKKFSTKTRIRYGETDQMGVVYHGNYAQYFELARTEWLRALGVTYKDMEISGISLPVIVLNFNFLKPALYDDVITIEVELTKKPMVKIEFFYTISNQQNEVLCTGSSTLAFMNSKTNKPMRCPDYILDKLDF